MTGAEVIISYAATGANHTRWMSSDLLVSTGISGARPATGEGAERRAADAVAARSRA